MIRLGQDALDGWAWMLFDVDGRLVASGEALVSVEAAVDHAVEAWAEARIRGDRAMPDLPHCSFPDGAG